MFIDLFTNQFCYYRNNKFENNMCQGFIYYKQPLCALVVAGSEPFQAKPLAIIKHTFRGHPHCSSGSESCAS